MNPLVSIIVPIYRTSLNYVEICFDSIVAQSYPHNKLELVVFIEDSPDKYLRLLERLLKNIKIPSLKKVLFASLGILLCVATPIIFLAKVVLNTKLVIEGAMEPSLLYLTLSANNLVLKLTPFSF